MRSVRPIIALFVVFVGLLAYLYFVDANRPDEEPREKAFDIKAEDIRTLRIESAEHGTTVLSKDKDTWKLTEPVAAPADQDEVSSLTSSLASLEIQQVVDENPGDLEQFGLAKPRVTVSFTTSGGDKPRRLLIGQRTPTEGHAYAKRDDESRVFLIFAYLDSTFDKKPFDLRNKRVLSFDRDKVDRLEIVEGGKRVEAVKEGLDWRLTVPVKARADYSAVEGVISRLHTAEMTSIVAEDAGNDLSKYGLDKPQAAVTVGAGSTRATIAFGSAAEDEDIYVRDASRTLVGTAAKSVRDDVIKDAADLRRKDIFEFRSFNATHLTLTRGSDAQVFEKEKSAEDSAAWSRIKPKAGKVDGSQMETLLTELSSLRADSFTDAAPKGSPALIVEARFDDGKKSEKVEFVRSGDEVFAVRGDEPGAAKVPAKEFDEAVAALDALK
ncbi:MAG TPA: DUF4340 domain-containing protein [Vicinamibacterales bacterium]|nr:DUF4340 domain-containing protein [Vicinamibacterales bacterium]